LHEDIYGMLSDNDLCTSTLDSGQLVLLHSRLRYSYGIYVIAHCFERLRSIPVVIRFYSQISNPSIVNAVCHNALLRIL